MDRSNMPTEPINRGYIAIAPTIRWFFFYRLTRPSILERSCTVTSLQGRRLRLLRTKTFSTMIRMPTIDGRLRTRLGTSITGLLSSMGSNHTNRVTISATTLIIAASSCYSSSMWRSKLGNYNSCGTQELPIFLMKVSISYSICSAWH